MSNYIYSFDTPPQDDDAFVVYTTGKQMITFDNLKKYQQYKEEHLMDDEVLGWTPLRIDPNFPGMGFVPAQRGLTEDIIDEPKT